MLYMYVDHDTSLTPVCVDECYVMIMTRNSYRRFPFSVRFASPLRRHIVEPYKLNGLNCLLHSR